MPYSHRLRRSGGYPGSVLAFEFLVPPPPAPAGSAAAAGRKSDPERAWAAEYTDAPREVCELALAYVNNDRVEAAYRRKDLFERCPTLMQQWPDYLAATA